ncbi:MAG: efflux RND transporter permease subunit [Candidatus Sumerlaeaceae bacterium]
MLHKLIHFSIQNRLFVLVAAVVLVLYGSYETYQLPVDVLPDLNRPTVTIMTESPGLAPEEVETLVTFPIETGLNGAAGVQRVRSTSGIGLSIVFVEFGWDIDILKARQLVAEKLSLVREQLPEGISPEMGPITSIMGEIMLMSVQSSTLAPMEVRSIADWTIRPRLLTIPGVSQVIPIGGGRMQVHVKVVPAKLKQFNLTMEEVDKAVKNANQNSTGGFLVQQGQEWLVRNIGRITKLDELAHSVVTYREGKPILLSSVAEITTGVQVKRGDAGEGGKPAVILSVQKQPGADTVELTKRVLAVVEELKSSLPPGVTINPNLFQQRHFIESSIDNLVEAIRDAAILVLIVLVLFLLNVRTTLITLTAIPLSFIVTGLFFRMAGISINTMTLGGLAVAIGELVDDAVIDVENVFRRLKENRQLAHPLNPLLVVYNASNEVRGTLVYATAMMIIVFIPLFQLSGIEGRIFRPLGIAYIVAIVASLVISITVTPALASYLLPDSRLGGHDKDSWLVRQLKRLDLVQLRFTLAFPNIVMGVFYALAIISVVVFLNFGKQFLPSFNEGTLTINLKAVPGTSLEESNNIGTIAERRLLEIPEVISVARRTGRAELDEHAEGVHSSEIDVDLKPSKRLREEILGDVREKLSALKGVIPNIGQPISHRMDHLLSGVNAQIAIKVFGDDLDVLRHSAEEIEAQMATVKGIVDLSVEQQVPMPQLQIKLLRDEAERYGVQVGDLARTLEGALYGEKVSEMIEGQRRYDIVVKYTDDSRRDAEALKELLIDTPTGGKVPLKAVADVLEGTGPNTVNRENVQRRIVIQANVADRDLGTIIKEVRRKVDEQVGKKLPPGYFITYGGQFEAQQQAARVIGLLSLLSLAVMYLLLYNLFRVHRVVLAVLFNVPLAMIGAVAAIAFGSRVFSIASLMGFITLTGISLRNGIMLINHYIHLLKEEGETFGKPMIIRGSLERLIPVLMTSICAALGLIPFAISAGVPGKEILQPMAQVMLAGLVSSTILDIMYTPAFFWRWCGPVIPRLLSARGGDFLCADPQNSVQKPAV